jgi:hypothetical protein
MDLHKYATHKSSIYFTLFHFHCFIIQLTTRDDIPLPHVPLHVEKIVQVVQLPSTGHGCVALQDVILIGEPVQ